MKNKTGFFSLVLFCCFSIVFHSSCERDDLAEGQEVIVLVREENNYRHIDRGNVLSSINPDSIPLLPLSGLYVVSDKTDPAIFEVDTDEIIIQYYYWGDRFFVQYEYTAEGGGKRLVRRNDINDIRVIFELDPVVDEGLISSKDKILIDVGEKIKSYASGRVYVDVYTAKAVRNISKKLDIGGNEE